MPVTQMKELLKHELGDLLYAEQKILRMLGAMNRESSNPKMKERVTEHLQETYEQIERLKRAFAAIGEDAKAEKCEAAIGLKEEHDSFVRQEKPSPPMLEAFDLGNGLRVEHYEIAGYRSAIAVAQAMGENEVIGLLTESLREEEAMASFLERNAVKALKLLSTAMEEGQGEEGKPSRASASRGKGAGKAAADKSGTARGASRPSKTAGEKGNGRSASGSSAKAGKKEGNGRAAKSAGKSGGAGKVKAGSSASKGKPGGASSGRKSSSGSGRASA